MEKVALGEICLFLNGYAFKSSNYVSSGIRIIRIANVQTGKIVDDAPCFYPNETSTDIEKYLLRTNDILVSLTGNVGRVGCLQATMLPAALNQRVLCLRVHDSVRTDFKYLYYFFQQNYFVNSCKKASSGVAQLNLSPKWLENYFIPLPSLNEQEKVVQKIDELFSDLDKGIEELQQAKKRLKIYRQAVLKKAFEGQLSIAHRSNEAEVKSDFKLLEKKNITFKDISGDESRLSLNIPPSWFMVRLGSIYNIQVGSTPSRKVDEFWGGDINWVSSGEVKFSRISETKEKITESGVQNSSVNICPKGSVLLAMIGEGKTRGQAALLNIPAAHNQNVASIVTENKDVSLEYVYYYLMLTYENTRRVGSGNNQKALNKERVKAIQIPFTSLYEQEKIVSEIEARLSVCDKIESIVEEQLQKAEGLRQSILKKAFEGRLV